MGGGGDLSPAVTNCATQIKPSGCISNVMGCKDHLSLFLETEESLSLNWVMAWPLPGWKESLYGGLSG